VTRGRPLDNVAAWHIADDLALPANLSLIFLLRERFLSFRLFPELDAIIKECCDA
jgi:hypothetical protein